MFESGAKGALTELPAGPDRLQVALRYTGAVALAWTAALLSARVAELGSFRLALSYSVVAGAAILAGPGPAFAALAVTVLAMRVYLPHSGYPRLTQTLLHGPGGLTAAAVLLLAGSITVVMILKFRLSEKRLQRLVQRLEAQAQALFQAQQASRSAAWTFDASTRRTRWYEGGAEIFGVPHAEITAMGSPVNLILPEDRAAITEAMDRTIRSGASFNVQFRVRWPNGELHWLEARGTPLPDRPHIWRGATMDITERKLADEALIRTEKLVIAGRLAASIAHEINNPLEAVTNLCYLARMTSEEPETRHYIGMAEEELRRVAQITSQTLRFHRQQSAAAETDITELVGSTLNLYEHKLAETMVTAELTSRPAAPLLCYSGEIRQVVANLIGNAIDAMPTGGVLRVRVRPATVWSSGAAALRITIADTGQGMRPETLRRIFEPFYTTKSGVGTGLGLWVSSTLVEKHGGRLNVRSCPEGKQRGTVFTITLPYPAGSTDAAVAPAASGAVAQGEAIEAVQA